MQERRVAHVISTPRGIGGAERVLKWLVDGAEVRGWKVLVLNPFDEEPGSSALAELLGACYVAAPRPSLVGVPAARRWLLERVAAFAPDVVHAHLFHALFLVATLPRRVAPVTVLSQQHGDYLRWRGHRLRARFDRWAERRFDRVVPCSHAVERVLLDQFGVNPARITVIHNGWTGDVEPQRGDHEHPTVVCVANLRAEKNHDALLKAFSSVRSSHPSARLNLVGAGPRHDELEQLATELGLATSVSFIGAVDDVWPHLAAADVFALSSSFEPLGIVVMEAMAAGLPVVATRVGGIPELVEEGVTGLLVDDDDVTGLTTALDRVLGSVDERRRMGDRGRVVASGLHADRMVERYFEVYELLLDDAAHRAR